jgi:hypothetical protein
MLVDAALFLGGLAALVLGADRAVTGAGDLALYYGVSPFFIGVTLVSVGTSVPEMVTSVYAAYYGAGLVGVEARRVRLQSVEDVRDGQSVPVHVVVGGRGAHPSTQDRRHEPERSTVTAFVRFGSIGRTGESTGRVGVGYDRGCASTIVTSRSVPSVTCRPTPEKCSS